MVLFSTMPLPVFKIFGERELILTCFTSARVCDSIFDSNQVALVVKYPACQCRRHKRHGFNPWVRKIPWRRAKSVLSPQSLLRNETTFYISSAGLFNLPYNLYFLIHWLLRESFNFLTSSNKWTFCANTQCKSVLQKPARQQLVLIASPPPLEEQCSCNYFNIFRIYFTILLISRKREKLKCQ